MKKQTEMPFKLLNQSTVDAIGAGAIALDDAHTKLYSAALELVEAGWCSDNLVKEHAGFNADLSSEVYGAIALTFPTDARKTIANSMLGLRAQGVEESNLRHLYKGKLRKAYAAILQHMRKVEEIQREGGRKAKLLHEVLDALLGKGIDKLQKHDGRNGEPISELLAAWRDCRARCNAVFKSSK